MRSQYAGYSNHLASFRSAIEKKDLQKGLQAAQGMRETSGQLLTIHDALDLLLLMSQSADPRFETAARRWLARLLAEGRPLVEIQIAVAASRGLEDLATAPRSELILRDLICWVEDAKETQHK
ncbi:MAG: hypothetical protein WB507_06170 [Solirubrobacterales bacterium]